MQRNSKIINKFEKIFKIRRFSQPLIKHSFNNESKNVEIQIIKNSNTNKNSRLNTLTSNRPVSSFKKHLNKDYLDTIMCESKILMSIINEQILFFSKNLQTCLSLSSISFISLFINSIK